MDSVAIFLVLVLLDSARPPPKVIKLHTCSHIFFQAIENIFHNTTEFFVVSFHSVLFKLHNKNVHQRDVVPKGLFFYSERVFAFYRT